MPQPHQPFLHDLITVLAAPTQLLSQRTGEIATSADRPTVQGVIHADVRVLSGLTVKVNGESAEHLATLSDGNRVQFTFVLPNIGVDVVAADPQLRLDWFRLVEPGQLIETLMISSQLPRAVEVDIDVELSADFARLELIKVGQPTNPKPIPVPAEDQLAWVEDDIAVSLAAEGAIFQLSEDRGRLTLQWHLTVPAHGEVSVPWQLDMRDTRSVVMASTSPVRLTNLIGASGRADHRLGPWLIRSLEDLEALWMATRDAPQGWLLRRGSTVVPHAFRPRQHLDGTDVAAAR